MATISGPSVLSAADLYTSTASPGDGLEVGQYVFDGKSGKGFRYSLAGGTTLVVGNLLQAAADLSTYTNMVVGTAAAAGDKSLQITNGTSTITNEQFQGGSLSVYTAGTIGVADEYTIVGVTGVLTTGGALQIALDRPLRAAVTTSATVNMRRSPWSGVVAFPATTQTGIPVGVAIYPIVNAQYGFVQTHGVCGVLSDGSTFAIGSNVGSVGGTTGAVTVYDAATTLASVGIAQQAAASAKGINVFLQID